MISDRTLATSYGWLWKSLTPMLDSFVRGVNEAARAKECEIGSRFESKTALLHRGFISDLAHRLLKAVMDGLLDPDDVRILSSSDFTRLVAESRAYIDRLEGRRGPRLRLTPGHNEFVDAIGLAAYLHKFFTERSGDITVFPKFAGCGLVDACEGDVVVGRRLYEIKTVERDYRAIEVRQLLLYCALNHASPGHSIDSVGLLNPRHGTCVELELGAFCREISGKSPALLFSEIIAFATTDRDST